MDYQLHKKAKKKVRRIKGFYIHAATYCIMGTFFFAINTVTDPFDMWFFYPLIPWGAFLAFHYLIVFGIPGSNILSQEWEEKEYQNQLEKLTALKYGKMNMNEEESFEEEELELDTIPQRRSPYFKDDLV